MTRGAYYSAGLHVAVIILALLGLPSFFDDKEPEPMVLTLELLPITKISNVPPSQKPLTPDKDKPKPTKMVKPKPPTKSNAPLPPKREKVTAPLDKPTPKDSVKKAPVKPPKPAKNNTNSKDNSDKPDKDETDLNAVLDAIRDQAQTDDSDKKNDKPTPVKNLAKSNAPYDPSLPMSISEMDAIRGQFVKCWRVPAGAKNDYELKVHVNVELRADGTVINAKLAPGDLMRYNGDTFFRGAADSAIRAVYKCSPLKNLPADKYSTWREMELTFDPRDLLY